MCTVVMTRRASKQVRKLSPDDRTRITRWIEDHAESDPRKHGKPMTGNLSGFWGYRVGKYRMLAKLKGDTVVLTNVALRKESYPFHHC